MKPIFLRIFLLTLTMGSFCLGANAASWTVETVPNTRQSDIRIHTSDPDDLIDPASQAEIDRLLHEAEAKYTAEIFVVALESTGQTDIKTFATELATNWRIGKDQKDNGLLILLVMDQQKITIETGYGMEGILPDALCFRIIDSVIVPYMRQNQVGDGLLAGVNSILDVLANPAAAEEIKVDQAALRKAQLQKLKETATTVLIIYLILTLVVFFFSVRNANRRIKSTTALDPYEAYKQLNTARVGYLAAAWIFPLLMAPFYWSYKRRIRKLRKKPRNCPRCAKPLMLMSEKQEDAYLSAGQQSEEMVGSVDYDAWVCMDCGYKSFLSYAKSFTQYKSCPKCGFKTFAQTADRIVVHPTPLSSGEGVHIHSCAHCGHEVQKFYTIPMIVVVPVGRGGRGGGGFGGGGGSFGGGSFGGGGATGGW